MRLEIKELGKSFNGDHRQRVDALANVTLQVDSGDLVSIVGPSGCGKTTLLEIIAGLQDRTDGQIFVDGTPVEESKANRAIVFQQYALFPWLTVRKNIEYGPKIRGVGARERRTKSREFIDMVGLAGFENYYPHELSGGMQQRVAIARALANDPDILLLDEPFAALDAQTKEKCQQELLSVWEQTRITILFVTHDIGEALFLSDQVFLMSCRPGTIKEHVEVAMERPRDASTRLNTGFRMKEAYIRKFLNNGGGLSDTSSRDLCALS